jgi:GNAT superfamily N-acetyltransferase
MGELIYTNLDPEHIEEAHRFEHQSFHTVATEDLYTVEEMLNVAMAFPEGNFMVLDDDRIIGLGMGILIDFDFDDFDHSLPEVSGEGGIGTHDAANPWYYGTTIAVDPAYRGRGIGRRLYALRKGCVRDLNKKGIVAGGVLPGYADHVDTMSAQEYIDKVTAGELRDPTLSFQLSEGFRAVAALENYMRDDTVNDCAVLIVWDNPDYRE